VPAACQNGAKTGDMDQHQDDSETCPDQHRSSRVSARNRHGKEKVYGSVVVADVRQASRARSRGQDRYFAGTHGQPVIAIDLERPGH
jgi:hypothetical protein